MERHPESMRWRVYLKGHEFDLSTAARLFRDGDPHVGTDSRGHFLSTTAFDDMDQALDVLDAAKPVVAQINGVAKVLEGGSAEPITLSSRLFDSRGQGLHAVVIADTIEVRAQVGAATIGGNTTASPPAPGPAVIAVTQVDADLQEALAIFGTAHPAGWGTLWKVWEIIRDANARGQLSSTRQKHDAIVSKGWATDQQIGDFRTGANDPVASGDEARHARQDSRHTPSPTPMDLPAAREFVRGLMYKWLRDAGAV